MSSAFASGASTHGKWLAPEIIQSELLGMVAASLSTTSGGVMVSPSEPITSVG
nr:hypothetical protein [uncultured Ruegeria sp.]